MFLLNVSERSLWYDGCVADSKFSNRHVTFESNSNRDVRFEFDEASQVPSFVSIMGLFVKDVCIKLAKNLLPPPCPLLSTLSLTHFFLADVHNRVENRIQMAVYFS